MKTLSIALFLLLTIPVNSNAAPIDQNLVSCSGNPGTMVQACSIANQEMAPAQPYDSDFYVSYRMSCNRSYPGPKPSRVQVKLENGQALTLNYNEDAAEVLVGTGRGPLTLTDTLPNELKNYRFNTCDLVFTKVRVEMGAAERQRIEDEKKAVREAHLTYLENLNQQVEFNRPLLLSQQAGLYFRMKLRTDAACLISRWANDDLFAEVVEDMKEKFASSFGPLEASTLDCSSQVYPELEMGGMKCSLFKLEGVSAMLANPDLPPQNRFFFETCVAEKNYLALYEWYAARAPELEQKLQEIQALGISDLTAQAEDLADKVHALLAGSCTSTSCPTKDVPVSSSL